jgi:hypothetical protein
MGIRKFPRVAGIEGIKKNQTITIPCMLNILLYVSGASRAPCGSRRFMRISKAANAPMRNITVMDPR